MQNTRELALEGFAQNWEIKETLYPTPGFLSGKKLLVLAILLPILFFWPKSAALETNLDSETLLHLVNDDRVRNGLRPLEANSKLERAAAAKARHILENNYFSHVSPAGVKPWDFIRNADFKYLFAGENLAINYTSPYGLERDFLQSPSHRENLLSPLFSETGIAVVSGRYLGHPAVIMVQLFAVPAPFADQ